MKSLLVNINYYLTPTGRQQPIDLSPLLFIFVPFQLHHPSPLSRLQTCQTSYLFNNTSHFAFHLHTTPKILRFLICCPNIHYFTCPITHHHLIPSSPPLGSFAVRELASLATNMKAWAPILTYAVGSPGG